eukprot:scaffold24518_cov51-Phaeocystis_antarctica.AAC.2
MRPGLRESIEPSGADGGNVGTRPGVEPCSDGLEFGRIWSNWGELVEFGKTVRTQAHRQYVFRACERLG